ncbi:MAG TPA: hypothetical protein VM659_14025 [Dongiaceae bacterium]|nr:hypothetical protein [Dongiaceae bacterium]
MKFQERDQLCVGHFSDLHYSPGNLVEADRCFGFAVDDAIAAGCDAYVISGDSTDHRLDAHSPAFSGLARRVHRLACAAPVLMLQGTFSHEPPGTLDVFRFVGGEVCPVYVADRIHQVALSRGEFIASHGSVFTIEELDEIAETHGDPKVVFTCVPTVNKATLAAAVGVSNAATAVGDHLAAYLAAAGAINRLLREQGIRTIGVSHGTVNGCQTEHGVPMAGFDHEFTIGSLFGADCDAFMLGHIHRAQQWEREGRVVAYPGSIGRFHYGEIGAKGYLRWNIELGQVTATLMETPARETVCVDFDGPPDMARLAEVAAGAADKFVRIRWSINEEHRQLVDRDAVQALFRDSAEVKIEARILPAVRSRAEGISRAASLPEKLGRWGELTGVDTGPLVDRLSQLQNLDAQSIADGVLANLADLDIPQPAPSAAEMQSALPASVPPVAPVQKSAALDWLNDDLFAAEAA